MESIFGNTGWVDGIYAIDENSIALQLLNLISKQQLDAIKLAKVDLFANFSKHNIEENRNRNALLYGLHADISEIEADYLIFGLFTSDSYDVYNIYKLTPDKLLIDTSSTWHSDRFSTAGYVFEGTELSEDKFKLAQSLLNEIPAELLTMRWLGFYVTEIKDEDVLLLLIKKENFLRTISIDSDDIDGGYVPEVIANYRKKVKDIFLQLNYYSKET